jgi:L-ascorbate metabolism protein UlaG (beta-lactamase superfamily)
VIKPVLQGDAFLSDVRNAAGDRLHLWWLGQSGFLVGWHRHYLLLDPYLSDSLTKKYASSRTPHVRMTERVIAPERLDFIEAVTSSHNHTDHLDAETLIPLLKANPELTVLVSRASVEFAASRLQITPGRLTPIRVDQEPISVGPFTFDALPSAHETLEQDLNGDYKCLGFIIHVAGRTIYHSGDAVPYDGLVERLRRWKIDVAILPINGRDAARGVPGNFTAEEAAGLGKAIDAGLVIPCHYEMFEFNSVSPGGFEEAARQIGQKYHVMKCGEGLGL